MANFKKDFPNHPDLIQCTMNNRLYTDSSHGIWDDGEWISWDYINDHVDEVERQAEYPHASIDAIEAFEDLVDAAIRYREATGRFLEIWGELGEVYAELKLGVKRHPAYKAGSDGELNGELVEIKTMSPGKQGDKIHVKSAGNFTKLIIIRISEHLEFDARILDRSSLRGQHGVVLKARWRDHENEELPSEAGNSRWQRVSTRLSEAEEN